MTLINKLKSDDANQDRLFICDQDTDRVNEIV